MSTRSSTSVQRVWSYCNVLRDGGISYGNCVKQLTYLLFPTMYDEGLTMLALKSAVHTHLNWSSLLSKGGVELQAQYLKVLKDPGRVRGRAHPRAGQGGSHAARRARRDPGAGRSAAGEPATVTTAAAVANAIFDATGVRLRQMPFTPGRVRAALLDRPQR